MEFGNRIKLWLTKLISKVNLTNVDNELQRQELYTANAFDGFLASVRIRQSTNLDQGIRFINDNIH